ncbi:DOMON-like domain-containing protein [Qipengyuania sediminis]|uniref:DOMON-like domain-containing protein n=1 Tax=Qipengyuania sediminis TaxID=1532023 RepID=UPI00105A5EA4|nr:DOMON-like domain-containing protein [Qipengyuania sediminis]
MQTHDLKPHPAFQPGKVTGVSVRWSELPDGRLMLRYRVDGASALVVPPFKGHGQADELWKTTCFELFLYDGGGRYRELNFSPSGQWALYGFAGYRNRDGEMTLRDLPEIKHERGDSVFVQTVFIDAAILLGAGRAALAAVIEEEGGRPSYWALAHNGLKPDFHDPFGFRVPLGQGGEG